MRKKLLNLCLAALLSAISTAAWALSEENGVYQIGTAEDFAAFAQLVNGGERSANAILTADIDLGTNNTKIGVGGDYEGIFDGATHTIFINFSTGTDGEGPALFRGIGQHSIIKRLKVQGTIEVQGPPATSSNNKHTAAIANYSGGIIRDCIVDVHIIADFGDDKDASIGGIVGQLNKLAVIENCLSKIKITGTTTHKCAGLAAWVDNVRVNIANCLVINDPESDFNWTDGKSAGLTRDGDNLLEVLNLDTYNADSYHNRPTGASANNFVTNDWGKLGKATTVVSADDVASGKVCYMLNSDQSQIRWVQNIGTDPYPVPAVFSTAGQVYASAATNCQGIAGGELTFSNSGSDMATKHTYDKWGVCTTCGQFNWNYFDFNDPQKFDPSDKSFLINKGADLLMAEGWNRFQNGCKFNLKLMNDVECKSESGQLIFNSNDWIESSFYGQGHTLTIEMVDIKEDYAALFPKWYLASGTGAVIENLILHGTIGTSERNAGSLIGRIYGKNHKVRNVFTDVTINTTHTGDCSHGGFLNCGDSNATFDNCIYAGDINGVDGSEAVAGFCGWANATNYFNNCAFLGTINNVGGDTHTISRNPGQARCSNVYSLNAYNGDENLYTLYDNPDGVASGELAYFLNGKQEGVERFYQLIGTDPEPMPIAKEGALVYTVADSYRCDGVPVSITGYANTPSEAGIPSHHNEDGFCTICGQLQEDYITPVDGWYEIGTPAQLNWLRAYAIEHTDVCARLINDIDYTGYPDGFIGTDAHKFSGTFDGQGYTVITDIKTDIQGTGLFGSIIDATIRNLVLEGSIESSKKWIGGVAGITRGDNTLIENVLVKSTIRYTGEGDSTGGGLCGDMEGAFTVNNCAFVGSFDIPNGTNVGGLVSWTGNGKFNNCYVAPAAISGASYKDFIHGGAGSCNNCFAVENTDESLTSGELCYKLNGNQFRNPVWYQTIGTDVYPLPIPNHGTVIYGAEKYFSVLTDEDVPNVAEEIKSYEKDLVNDDIIATQALIDELSVVIEALTADEASTLLGFTDAYYALEAAKAAVEESKAVYQAYIDKCNEVQKTLDNDHSFEGSLRNTLEYYLDDDVCDEPNEDNALGTKTWILENHVATNEEITAEIARIDQWLADAIAEDYKAGTDVSKLIPNYDFSQGREHWEGNFGNFTYGKVKDGDKTVVGVEAWNSTGEIYQTVEGMKPGYYLVGINAAFRPSNNRYSTNYAAGIYANGNFNYFPTACEDPLPFNEATDGENCHLSGEGALDLAIYQDGTSTEGEDGILGYAPHGAMGMAYAVKGDRYQAYTIANVGEDGKLTIGIKNPGTKYSNDWTGWGALKVTYCGQEADDALSTVLGNMTARAQKLIAYTTIDRGNDKAVYESQPYFSEELKDSLRDAIGFAENVETVEAKLMVAETFSRVFQKIYEGKRAYVNLYNYASMLENLDPIFANGSAHNLPLVAKNENGEWEETGEHVFSVADGDVVFRAFDYLFAACFDGSLSTEEALNPVTALDESVANVLTEIVPTKSEDGYFLLGTPKQFVTYRALFLIYDQSIKAKLVNDIDMTGIGMKPFGNTSSGTSDSGTIYKGVFDGQNHALENVYLTFYGGRRCGLFYELQNATVKNLKLTGEYYTDGQRMGGLTGWTSGNTKIENCEIAVAMYSDVVGDATTGGIMGVNGGGSNTIVDNCLVNCTFYGENAHSFGGVCGWKEANLTVKNTLILSQYANTAAEPGSYPTSVISRNGWTDGGNVFYAESAYHDGVIKQATLVTDEQLASGEITWKLNGEQSDTPVWFQTLGEDEHPELFGDHKVVLYNENKGYYNEGAVGDLNNDGKVDIADAVTVLNIMAAGSNNPEADLNGDGKIDIADFVTVLNIMAAQ